MLTVLGLLGVPVGAAADPLADLNPLNAPATELVMRGTEAGQGVRGYIAPVGDTAFDPTAGYPTSKPAGFSDLDLGFAGIITASPAAGGSTVRTYCIDVRTPTRPGIGYVLGEWSSAQVPLVGYVARILDSYYPNTTLPAASNNNQRAAAVQAAIWFFTDKYVLRSSDSVFALTKAIVEDVLAKGPVASPTPPSLQIAPPADAGGPIGSLLGPFVITTTAPATLTVTGGQMFSDAAGTIPVTNPVNNGARVWLRSTTPGAATLKATAQATIPSGNVYLYDGKTPGVAAAQKLILAQTSVLTTAASASVLFFDTGTLVVEKEVTGNGAGLQSDVVVGITCQGIALPDFVIPAGSPAGVYNTRYGPIQTPASCVVTETSSGGNTAVTASATAGITIDLPQNSTPGDETSGRITNTFTQNPGSLVLTKTIGGDGQNLRSDIDIDVACTDGTQATFKIPAGQSPAPNYTVSPITAGASCTVTETANGGNASVSNDVAITPDPIDPVPPGGSVSVAVENRFATRPGALVITKAITGVGADRRGDIVIDAICDNGTRESFTIPAAADPDPAGYRVDGLPSGTTCVVTESQTGGNSEVSVTVTGLPDAPVAIPPGGTASVPITNTFELRPGSLLVTKSLTGSPSALAARDRIVIDVACDNGASSQYVVEPGQEPDPNGYLLEGLPAGTRCTISESSDGSNGQVANQVTISANQVVIAAGGQESSAITNALTLLPASLTVTKTIGGRGDLRSDIQLSVECSDGSSLAISIPTGSSPAPAGYTLSNIAGDATCSVREVASGANGQVAALAEGLVTDLNLQPGGVTPISVSNTFTPNPGTLVVGKTLSGTGVNLRGEVVIEIVCTDGQGAALFTENWGIPATETDPRPRTFQVPADARCTVTESADGSNGQTAVTTSFTVDGQLVDGPAVTTIPPGGISALGVENEFVTRPGSLVVTKTISGTGAGQQGDIVIDVACRTPEGSSLKPQEVDAQLSIPAGATSGTGLLVDEVPAGLVCRITESVDGSSETVTVVTVMPDPVSIAPGAASAATVVNTYTPAAPPPGPDVPGGSTPDTGAGNPMLTSALGLLLLAAGWVLFLSSRRAVRRA